MSNEASTKLKLRLKLSLTWSELAFGTGKPGAIIEDFLIPVYSEKNPSKLIDFYVCEAELLGCFLHSNSTLIDPQASAHCW